MHLRFEAQYLLGVASAEIRGNVDAVSRLYAPDPISNASHNASRICTWGIWKLGFDRVGAAALICLERIYADCAHFDHDLSRSGTKIRDFFDLQDLGPAELVNMNCFHGTSSLISWKRCEDSYRSCSTSPGAADRRRRGQRYLPRLRLCGGRSTGCKGLRRHEPRSPCLQSRISTHLRECK